MAKNGSGPFKVVRACDVVEFITADDFKTYLHGRDFSILKFEADKPPTIWHCRHLTLAERREVRNKSSLSDMHEAAFVRGLMKVTNLDGKEYHRPTDSAGKDRIIPDKDLESLFDEAMVQEIGSVVHMKSFLDRTTTPDYPLPAICQSALVGVLSRLAVQINDTVKQLVLKKAAEEVSPISPSSSNESADSGPVTVTESSPSP